MKNVMTYDRFKKQLDARLISLGYKKYQQLHINEYCLLYKQESIVESYYCFFRTNNIHEWVEYIDNDDYNPLFRQSYMGKEELTSDNLERLFKLAGDIITKFKKDKIEKKIEEIEKDFR